MRSSLSLFMLLCIAIPYSSHASHGKPLVKNNITTVTSSSQSLPINTKALDEQFESQVFSYNDALHYLYEEKMQLSQLKAYQQDLQQGQVIFSVLANQLDVDNYDHMRFINNYATLLSNYAELLDHQYCYQQSLGYWQQSDEVYQAGKIYQKKYPTLAYNQSLNFARQSVFYRKNKDQTQRLELLKQAEQISRALVKNHPLDISFQQHHLNVLLDQLDIYQQQADSYNQQKFLFDQLNPSYFKVLKRQNMVSDFGNTMIFIQKYYRYLYIHDPNQAMQWLNQQHDFIENYRSRQRELSQREKEFLAGYYAANRQFDLAMSYLEQLDPEEDDATSVRDFKSMDPLYANIRYTPAFQLWLNNYEKHYLVQQKQKQCRIPTL